MHPHRHALTIVHSTSECLQRLGIVVGDHLLTPNPFSSLLTWKCARICFRMYNSRVPMGLSNSCNACTCNFTLYRYVAKDGAENSVHQERRAYCL